MLLRTFEFHQPLGVFLWRSNGHCTEEVLLCPRIFRTSAVSKEQVTCVLFVWFLHYLHLRQTSVFCPHGCKPSFVPGSTTPQRELESPLAASGGNVNMSCLVTGLFVIFLCGLKYLHLICSRTPVQANKSCVQHLKPLKS